MDGQIVVVVCVAAVYYSYRHTVWGIAQNRGNKKYYQYRIKSTPSLYCKSTIRRRNGNEYR